MKHPLCVLLYLLVAAVGVCGRRAGVIPSLGSAALPPRRALFSAGRTLRDSVASRAQVVRVGRADQISRQELLRLGDWKAEYANMMSTSSRASRTRAATSTLDSGVLSLDAGWPRRTAAAMPEKEEALQASTESSWMSSCVILAGMCTLAGATHRRRAWRGRGHKLSPAARAANPDETEVGQDKVEQSIENFDKGLQETKQKSERSIEQIRTDMQDMEEVLDRTEAKIYAVAEKFGIKVENRPPVAATPEKAEKEAVAVEEDVAKEVADVIPAIVGILGWVAAMYALQHKLIPLSFLSGDSYMYAPIALTFVAGYATIVLEELLEISKTATALMLGVIVWVLVGTGVNMTTAQFTTNLNESFEEVAEVVFFLLGALTIVEIMDAHKGFDIVTKFISATKRRDLIVIVGLITFALSSVLNNLTVVIVMVSLMQKLITDTQFRLQVGGVIVVTSNAGGAWTPIGDITTTMLYLGGQVTTVPLIANLVFPSLLCAIGTIGFEYFKIDPEATFDRPKAQKEDEAAPEGQQLVFWSGLVGMVSVPVFSGLTQCPAWSGMMLVLGFLGVITSTIHKDDERYSLAGATSRIEVPDALFFLGILFAVGGLEKAGLLKEFAAQLSTLVPNDSIVAVLLGFASAVVDNVPLVAATQGMYDMSAHPANTDLWNLICYCAATGGSLLVIGSAAGVAFLGMEKKVSFGWYLQNVTPGALLGYLCGVAGIIAQQSAGFAIK